jgi:cytochrome c2
MVEREFPDADPEAGREYLVAYGCGACHRIEGIRSAAGTVGPPLVDYEQRHYVAGNLKNTPANLTRWIRFPQEVEPGTAMPNLGVSEAEARAMVAYLYSR